MLRGGDTMRVAAINDLSGFGRCSLVSDIATFSAMGIETCAVPTAVLSSQTGYSSYYCKDLTEVMPKYINEYKKMDVKFDGIITGFMLSETQANSALEFIRTFKNKNTIVLVDPVLGDDGERYVNYSDEFLNIMKKMVSEADIITPNITELCLLADIEPGTLKEYTKDELLSYLVQLSKRIMGNRKQIIAVTGIPMGTDNEVGNLVITDSTHKLIKSHTNGVHYSGTGDFFAAILLGGILNGKNAYDSVELASNFIRAAVADSQKNGKSGIEGIVFEKHLDFLLSDISHGNRTMQ